MKLGRPDLKVKRVPPALKATPEPKGRLAHKVRAELLGQPVRRELKGTKGLKARQVLLVLQGFKVTKGLLAQRDLQVSKELKVRLEQPELKVSKVRLGPQARLARQVLKV